MEIHCRACDKILSKKDLYLDEELCQHCIASIRHEIRMSQRLETYGNIELPDDEE